MEKKQLTIDERIDIARLKEDIPNIHFNGFISSLGTGDIFIVLENNNKPVAVLNASYTVAKTFAAKLNGLIQRLEERSGNSIMTIDEIEEFIKIEQEKK